LIELQTPFLAMQPQQHNALHSRRVFYRFRSSCYIVTLLAAAAICLLSITVNGQVLTIQQSGTSQYSVSWPSTISAAYSLYSTTDLANGPWTPVPGTHALAGNQWQINSSTTAPRMFFRLQTTLRADPSNPRYFNNGAGIVFLTGSYWVNTLEDDSYTGPFDYTAYLNFLLVNGHNFIRMMNLDSPRVQTLDNPWSDVSPVPFQRPGPGNAGDNKPKFDLSKLDQTFFDRLRARVIEAGNHGIYVAYLLFDGWALLGTDGQEWTYMAHNPANNINGLSMTMSDVFTLNNSNWVSLMDAYVDKVVDTLNDLDNVIYEVLNEAPGSSNSWQEHVVNRIHAREASLLKQHPVGRSANDWRTTDATSNTDLLAGAAEWVGLSGREGTPYRTDVPDAPVTKVSLLDSDHIWGVGGTAPYISAPWVWKCLLRGHNPLYLDVNTYHPTSQYPSYSSDPAVVAAMGYVRALASRIDLAHMVPNDATSSTGYALANANREYLIYQPATSSFSATLPAESFSYEWIDPSIGSVTQTGTYSAVNGSNMFNLPAGFSNGAVLHLVAAPGP
jgi:hypothetical protein